MAAAKGVLERDGKIWAQSVSDTRDDIWNSKWNNVYCLRVLRREAEDVQGNNTWVNAVARVLKLSSTVANAYERIGVIDE
jgi:hypothetical protein